MNISDTQQIIEQLHHKSSPKRRSAAKKLRKLKAKEACPTLLDRLKKELNDKRTWETQYQIIMALGELEYIESLEFLSQLTEQEFEATMVLLAIGDAVTTLEIINNALPVSLIKWIKSDKKELVDGGLRSLAMHRIIPKDNTVKKIIEYVALPENKDIQFWAVAAAPGWPKKLTTKFLNQATNSAQLEDTRKAAKAALNGNYLKWYPL